MAKTTDTTYFAQSPDVVYSDDISAIILEPTLNFRYLDHK